MTLKATGADAFQSKLKGIPEAKIEEAFEKAITKLTKEVCYCEIISTEHSLKTNKSRIKIDIQFGTSRRNVALIPD